MTSCLCLGPSGSGKTLLLKRLQNQTVTKTTVPIETVGTDLVNVPRLTSSSDRQGDSRPDYVEVREVGGAMAPLWPSYYGPGVKTILFVIDASNLFQVSISTVLLMEILVHPKLTQAKVLVILSQVDSSTRKKINYLKFMMRIPNIIQEASGRVGLEEVSGLNGDGVENVRNWIDKHSPKGNTRNRRN